MFGGESETNRAAAREALQSASEKKKSLTAA